MWIVIYNPTNATYFGPFETRDQAVAYAKAQEWWDFEVAQLHHRGDK